MATGRNRGDPREFLDVGPHLGRTQRTVDADRNQIDVSDRVPEGLKRLAGKRAARVVGDGDRDSHRQTHVVACEMVLDSEQAGLQVQRVEGRLGHQQIDATIDQPGDLLPISLDQLVETDSPETGVVDVR